MSMRPVRDFLGVILAVLALGVTVVVGPAAAASSELVGPANFGCDLVLDSQTTDSLGTASLSVGKRDVLARVIVALRGAEPNAQFEARLVFSSSTNTCLYGGSDYLYTNARGAGRLKMQPQPILASRVRVLVQSTSYSAAPYSALFENLPITPAG